MDLIKEQVIKEDENVPSLHQVLQDHFSIGAAVNPVTILSHRALILKHFNSITAENQMKFAEIHPAENRYTFEAADTLVDFAVREKKQVRGHTLIWHNQTTSWVFDDGQGDRVTREVLLDRMKSHIDHVLKRYRGTVYAWDVVNEAVDDQGPHILRNTKWLEIIGEDYIRKAFEFAHAADPGALLFYNDYNETHPDKRDRIYTLLKSLIEQEVPIHGMGMQGHWGITGPSIEEIEMAIVKYASLGLQIQITELDISVFTWGDNRTDLKQPTAEMMNLQAERYEQIFQLFKQYQDVITGVTFWGVADDRTWLDNFPVKGRKNWPFLFDENHRPKHSFWKVV